MRVVTYDIEIVRAIQKGDQPREADIAYCEGWGDKANMGVSAVCAIVQDMNTIRPVQPRIFMQDNLEDFVRLADEADVLAGFNSKRFDDVVMGHAGYRVQSNYDLLEEIWLAEGLDPDHFEGKTHGGYGLDRVALANGLGGKTGHGADAPIDFQRARYGTLLDYCMRDVWLTHTLIMRVQDDADRRRDGHGGKGFLVHPNDPADRTMEIAAPEVRVCPF